MYFFICCLLRSPAINSSRKWIVDTLPKGTDNVFDKQRRKCLSQIPYCLKLRSLICVSGSSLFAAVLLRVGDPPSHSSYLLADCISILGSPPCQPFRLWRCLLLRVRGNTVGERNALCLFVSSWKKKMPPVCGFRLATAQTTVRPCCLAGSIHWRNREGETLERSPGSFCEQRIRKKRAGLAGRIGATRRDARILGARAKLQPAAILSRICRRKSNFDDRP